MKNQKPGIKDYIHRRKYSLLNWMYISKMSLKLGPHNMIREMIRYPWMWDLLKVNGVLKKLSKGRSGNYRKSISLIISTMVKDIVEILESVFHDQDRLVLHQAMLPNEILVAMGLKPWMHELLSVLLPFLDPRAVEKYIDAAENAGYPSDLCNFPKHSLGVSLLGHEPLCKAIVLPSMACDGEFSAYNTIQRKYNIPTFRLDVPYNFKGPRAEEYIVKELYRMIDWLEKNTPGRMNWDKLKDICEERNRMVEYEMELWEMLRHKPAPLTAEAISLSHLWGFYVSPAKKSSTEMFKKLLALGRENMEQGISAFPGERYRALLWNPPIAQFPAFVPWMEKKYGISVIMDSMSYSRIPYIDTSSEESMLLGLGRIIMNGPMARHMRGPMENYLDDMFHIQRQFNIDMFLVAGNIGCKDTSSLYGILRERAREKGIPLLIIDYSLLDHRITSDDEICAQVDDFMENVMKAEPQNY